MELPKFKYHPNPFSTGAFEDSDATCRCCGEARGCIYAGSVYAVEDMEYCICPWCIADGSAHEKFDCEFTDSAGVGAREDWDDVPMKVIEEVAHRTPGFTGIQEEMWWTHCGDAAQFLRIVDDEVKFRCRHCGAEGGYRDYD